MTPWDKYYMLLALVAAQKSKDSSTKVGAVIVGGDNSIISTGYNGPPPHTEDGPWEDRGEKLRRTLHAEQNALLRANRNACIDGTMYVTAPPCSTHGCAPMICTSGIGRVVAIQPGEAFYLRWKEDVATTKALFREAGIRYEEVFISEEVKFHVDNLGVWIHETMKELNQFYKDVHDSKEGR